MLESRFQERLQREFDARKKANSRYSLRAFAALLGSDHSTLSQILKGARRTPVRQIRSWAKKLGMGVEEASAYIAAEHVPDLSRREREEQLRHWTAEAMAVVTEPAHWDVVRLSRSPSFRYDCRWIAAEVGVSVDVVNVALARLWRLELITIGADGAWRETVKPRPETEREFRKVALARVRQKAAEVHVKLPSIKK